MLAFIKISFMPTLDELEPGPFFKKMVNFFHIKNDHPTFVIGKLLLRGCGIKNAFIA